MPLTNGCGEELAKRVSAGAASCAKREAAYFEWRMVISSKSSTPQRFRFWHGRRGTALARQDVEDDVGGMSAVIDRLSACGLNRRHPNPIVERTCMYCRSVVPEPGRLPPRRTFSNNLQSRNEALAHLQTEIIIGRFSK